MHAVNYHGTDDDMPESFDDWLAQLDGEEYIRYADMYGSLMYEAGILSEVRDEHKRLLNEI